MTMSNFPSGFKDGFSVRGMPLVQTHPGKVVWVYNGSAVLPNQKGGSNGNDGSFNAPYSTLDYAISQCTANRGDVIMIKPGHAETISTATALAFDVAGIAIVGLGAGSNRPTFTLDTATTATIAVSAANVSIQNVIITANFADIVSVFTVTADDFTIDKCTFKATATNMNFLHVVDTGTTDGSADRLVVTNSEWIDPDAATLAFALVDSTNDGWQFRGNYVNIGGSTTAAALFTCATTKALTNLRIMDNIVIKAAQTDGSAGFLLTSDATSHTGMVARNYSQNTDDAANIIVFATSGLSVGPDNFHSGHENEHGVAITTAFNNA